MVGKILPKVYQNDGSKKKNFKGDDTQEDVSTLPEDD